MDSKFRRRGLKEQLKTIHHGTKMAEVAMTKKQRDSLRSARETAEAQLDDFQIERFRLLSKVPVHDRDRILSELKAQIEEQERRRLVPPPPPLPNSKELFPMKKKFLGAHNESKLNPFAYREDPDEVPLVEEEIACQHSSATPRLPQIRTPRGKGRHGNFSPFER